MKKVLFVATVVKLHIMLFHIPYLEWFKKNGYEVHVAARNDYKNKSECNIPFCDRFYDIPFERKPIKINNFYAYKELKKIIKTNEYEIVHCHTPIGGVLTRLAGRKARKKGTKVFYTAHGFHFYKGAPVINWLVYYPVEKWLARYTDILITINDEDYAIAKTFKATNVVYVPGIGIDLCKFSNIKADREKIRNEMGIPKDTIVLLTIGEMIKRKNHETALKALAHLKKKNYIFLLCGKGELESHLKQLAIKLGIADKVRFLGFRNDIPEICFASDIFIFPSYQEGLPVSVMEAMSAGLPVIASKIRGVTDLIQDGIGGYLHDPEDYIGIARSIDKVMCNSKLREEMGNSNKEVIKNYDKKVVKEIMSKLYNI